MSEQIHLKFQKKGKQLVNRERQKKNVCVNGQKPNNPKTNVYRMALKSISVALTNAGGSILVYIFCWFPVKRVEIGFEVRMSTHYRTRCHSNEMFFFRSANGRYR